MTILDWFKNRRRQREARRLLDQAFATPALLKGTSLKPHHRSRSQVLGFDVADGRIVRIEFGIPRHPRPYAFSRQSHHVIELYVYDVDKGTIEVVKGINLTRRAGRDAD